MCIRCNHCSGHVMVDPNKIVFRDKSEEVVFVNFLGDLLEAYVRESKDKNKKFR